MTFWWTAHTFSLYGADVDRMGILSISDLPECVDKKGPSVNQGLYFWLAFKLRIPVLQAPGGFFF